MNKHTLNRWQATAKRKWDLNIGKLFKVDGTRQWPNWDFVIRPDDTLRGVSILAIGPLLYIGEDLFLAMGCMQKIRIHTPQYKWKDIFDKIPEE